jgi:hypothetical protein
MENFLTAAKLHTHAKRFMDAYSAAMQPLSREFAIPQTAAEILLFLANNPENSTAKEICAMRHLKPGIVSLHVDTLAKKRSRRPAKAPPCADREGRGHHRPGQGHAGGVCKDALGGTERGRARLLCPLHGDHLAESGARSRADAEMKGIAL